VFPCAMCHSTPTGGSIHRPRLLLFLASYLIGKVMGTHALLFFASMSGGVMNSLAGGGGLVHLSPSPGFRISRGCGCHKRGGALSALYHEHVGMPERAAFCTQTDAASAGPDPSWRLPGCAAAQPVERPPIAFIVSVARSYVNHPDPSPSFYCAGGKGRRPELRKQWAGPIASHAAKCRAPLFLLYFIVRIIIS